MAKSTKDKKGELLKVKLAEILIKHASDPRFEGVTLIKVVPSPDSSSALVFYAVYAPKCKLEEVTDALNKSAGFFQEKLANSLKTRNTPRLKFVYDKGFDHADRIDRAFQSIE